MHSWRQAAHALALDLERIFAGRLRSVVAYGSHVDGDAADPLTCLALVDSLGITDLEECAGLATQWERQHIATPLVLPTDEFRRSLDAFPLEYGDILHSHALIFGTNPFDGVLITDEDLRRGCETQAKSHLIHLREGFVEAGQEPGAIADLVKTSAPAFVALLRHVARLDGQRTSTRAEAAVQGGRAAGLPDHVVSDLVTLAGPPPGSGADAARLFPDYLAAAEQLALSMDGWRAHAGGLRVPHA